MLLLHQALLHCIARSPPQPGLRAMQAIPKQEAERADRAEAEVRRLREELERARP